MKRLLILLAAACILLVGPTIGEVVQKDYISDFSTGSDGWYARSAGGAVGTVTVDGAFLITGRTASWNSPGRDFALVPGMTYRIEVEVSQGDMSNTPFILSVAHTRDGQ